jgi:sulfur-oxidizing protein SoxZ
MALTKPRIKVPENAKPGDIIEVKTLIQHVMETGQRKDAQGNTVPRNILNTFVASFAGQEVFRADLQPGISANPYLAFYMRVSGPGELQFTWIEDTGDKLTETVKLKVA